MRRLPDDDTRIKPTSSILYFGVMDGVFSDSGGRFAITVGVPEPASWAILIASLRLVGATMRRRRLVQA